MAGSSDSGDGWKIGFFVLLLPLLLTAVAAYFGFKQATDERIAANAAAVTSRDAKANLQKLDTGVEQLKELVGFNSTDLVDSETSVVKQLDRTMNQYAGAQRQPTVDATLQAMSAEAQRLQAEIASLEDNLRERDERLRNIESAYQNRVDQATSSQRTSENKLQDKTRQSEDIIADKDGEIDTWRADYEKAQIDKEELADTLQRVREEKDKEIVLLRQRVEQLGREVNKIRDVSFEEADGLVRSVDAVQGICTINLGSLDNLPPQTSFSVYKKNNAGIGRGLEDVKGSIEVVRILGPHLAEARILDQDIYDPISPKDLIYSPLWQAGQTEHFAFIGKMDMNRDGTDDRNLLFRIVENAGAKVDFYISDKAKRVPEDGAISEKTKFLVLGELPNPSQFANRDEEYQNALDVLELKKKLDNEALQYGKRVVSLPDFLTYMGYKPTNRSFRPGSGVKYSLESGRKSDGQKARPLLDSLPKY